VSTATEQLPLLPLRRKTREVMVGDVGVGGTNPIRIQSMTNTDTLNTEGTVAQIQALVEAGCEIVRLTVPSKREAENLVAIRSALTRRSLSVPLVADIHFTPNAALIAAEHVEKIRVNPGNFADKKQFRVEEYSNAEYAREIERVAERFRPLVRRCKELGRALRIGTNHGSLSDRILNRFGDTPEGMVESALEFLDVCEQESYVDVIFSMKASNTQVAIQAYRLLAARLAQRAPGSASYPFHVGVTEAGDGEDGRIKSAIGIGALLEDGIGDTIRVSLTEDPVREIPVARALAGRAKAQFAFAQETSSPILKSSGASYPLAYRRRHTNEVRIGGMPWGGANPIRVEVELRSLGAEPEALAREVALGLRSQRDIEAEGLVVALHEERDTARFEVFVKTLREEKVAVPVSARLVETAPAVRFPSNAARILFPLYAGRDQDALECVAASARRLEVPLQLILHGELTALTALMDRCLALRGTGLPLLLSVDSEHTVHAVRFVAARLGAAHFDDCLLQLTRFPSEGTSSEEGLLDASVVLGSSLCDGLGDGLLLPLRGSLAETVALGYRILQGARLRTSWTEFISCPSCGRTLFDLEETTARIKARTGHLKGVKIAIMGCIVNGPGEMADADFGYVGAGIDKVNLYVGKQVVARNVSQAEAESRLVDLIREQGRWIDPETKNASEIP